MDDNFNLNNSPNDNPSEHPCESDTLKADAENTIEGINADVTATPAFEEIKPETPAAPVFEEIKPEAPAAPVFEEIKAEAPAAPVFEEIKPETPAAPVFEEIKPETPAAPVFNEIKPETPAAPVFNEIKPETPAAPVFEEIKPETPAAPIFNEIKPETPAAPVFNEIEPQAPAAPAGPRWSDFTAPQSVQAQDPEAGMSMTERIVHRLRKHRFEPNILLNFVNFDRRPHALLDTKIGGPYYVPEDKKVPCNLQTGGELFLLAQINFATMPKQPDFPTDGLLQFFIDPDPHAFAAHKHPTQQIAWRVRYIPEVPSYTSIATNGYKPDTSQFEGKLTTMPFDCRRFLMLKGSDTQQFICWDDFPFQAMLDRYCSDLLPANPSDSDMMALRTARMDAMNQLRREFKPGKAQDFVIQMGGYPTFHGKNDIRMEDPRFPGIRTPNVLLLQLPSFDGFQWGGDRIVHFFISRKDLRERNFNHVMTDI